MSVLSYLLGGAVFIYTVIYTVSHIAKIVRFQRCEDAGNLEKLNGEIVEKAEEQNKNIHGNWVNLSFPKFKYEVSGKERYLQWGVRYQNAEIGQKAIIGYCERTMEAWIIKDIPLMKRELIIKVSIMAAILIALVLTEVIL